MSDWYAMRGVSASKDEVKRAVQHLPQGLFPDAFCKVVPDFSDPDYCLLSHADGAGTKPVLAYLQWRETGDARVWAGIVQDALAMNLDDMACAGCFGPFVVSSVVSRNRRLVGGDALERLIAAGAEQAELLRSMGFELVLAGGETADMGDVVRTLDVSFTLTARMPRNAVLSCRPTPGDVIVGLASDGRAVYENRENSGIGCNGLTGARHDLLSDDYRLLYPETFDPGLPSDVVYKGRYRMSDPLPGSSLTVGEALLAPTRYFLPVVARILRDLRPNALIHSTGGGQTKCLSFLKKGRIVKDWDAVKVPAIFSEIQRTMPTDWRDMFRTYNMGVRLEVYVRPDDVGKVHAAAAEFGIRAYEIGRVEASGAGLTIRFQGQEYTY